MIEIEAGSFGSAKKDEELMMKGRAA